VVLVIYMYSFVMSEFSGSECVGYLLQAALNHYLSRSCRRTACDQAGTDPGPSISVSVNMAA